MDYVNYRSALKNSNETGHLASIQVLFKSFKSKVENNHEAQASAVSQLEKYVKLSPDDIEKEFSYTWLSKGIVPRIAASLGVHPVSQIPERLLLGP